MSGALFRALFALALFGALGACDTVKRIPSQVGELGARVGGWFSFGGADGSAVADDPHVIVLPLSGTDWLGRPALAEEVARLLRATTPNARAGTTADGRSRTIEGQVETIEEGDSVVWLEIAWTYRGRDGAPIAEHRQIAAMDSKLWTRASPAAVQMIASEIAPKAAALLRNESPRLIAARAAGGASNSGGFESGGEIASNQPAATHAPPPVRHPPPLSAAHAPFAQDPAAYAMAPSAPPSAQAGSLPPPAAAPFARGPAVSTPAAPPPPPSARAQPLPPAREIASAAPVAPVQGSPLSSAWANPVILVKMVEGAPGDGNQALMLAIKQALWIRNFMVTEDPRQAVFLIDGRVEIAPAANVIGPHRVVRVEC
jgi:hypothetical protein